MKDSFAKRAFLSPCLALSLALLGGCSYSASSTRKNVALSFVAKDGKKTIWSDEGVFGNVNLSVRPGERTPYSFVVENPNMPAFEGPFDFEYNFTY